MAKEVRLALSSFLDSSFASEISEREATREIATAFFEACFDDLGKVPRLLEEHDLEALLLELIPARLRRKDRRDFPALQVIQALLAHIEASEVVPQAWELRRTLDSMGQSFETAVNAGKLAGTRSKKQATVSHQAGKIGRNDPCWCGSGKKFKKCCGANE